MAATAAVILLACVAQVGAQTICARPVDLVLVLDESGSVNNNEWDDAKDFMKQIVGRYNIGQGASQTRVSIVPFSQYVTNTLHFHASQTTALMQDWIGDMPRTYQSMTCTGKAMNHISTNVIPTSKPKGYRNGAGGASTVVVFLTDGVRHFCFVSTDTILIHSASCSVCWSCAAALLRPLLSQFHVVRQDSISHAFPPQLSTLSVGIFGHHNVIVPVKYWYLQRFRRDDPDDLAQHAQGAL